MCGRANPACGWSDRPGHLAAQLVTDAVEESLLAEQSSSAMSKRQLWVESGHSIIVKPSAGLIRFVPQAKLVPGHRGEDGQGKEFEKELALTQHALKKRPIHICRE
jgi:hypothetical protein